MDYHAYYQDLGLPASVVSELEEMRASAPARNVGKRALAHLIADLNSRRNARPSLQEIYGGCLVLFGALALGLSVQKVRRGEVNRKSASGR